MRIRAVVPYAVLITLAGGVLVGQQPADPPNKHPLAGWDPNKPVPAGFEVWYLTDKPDTLLFVERPKAGGLHLYSIGGEDRGKFAVDGDGNLRDKHGVRLHLDANTGTMTSKDGKIVEKLTKGLPPRGGPNDRWRPSRPAPTFTLPDKVSPAIKRVVLTGDWSFKSLGQCKITQTATGFTLVPAMGPTLTMRADTYYPNVYHPEQGMPNELWLVTGKNHLVRAKGPQVDDNGARTSPYPVAALPFGLVPTDRSVDLGGHWRGSGTTIYLEWAVYGYLFGGATLSADPIWPNVYRNGADLWVPLDDCLLAVVQQGQLKLYLRDATFPLHHQLTGTGGFAASRATLDYTGTWRSDGGSTLTFAKQGTDWRCTDGNGALADGTLNGVQSNFKNQQRLVFPPVPAKGGDPKTAHAAYHLDLVFVDANTAVAGFDSRLAVVYRRNGPPVAPPTVGFPATTLYHVAVKYVGDTKPPYATRTGGAFAIVWGEATLTGDPASSFLRKAERSVYADRSDVFTCPGDAVPKPESVLLSQANPTKVDRIEVSHRGGTTLIPCNGTLPAAMTKYELKQVALVNDLNTYAEVYERVNGAEAKNPVAVLPPDGSLFLPTPLPDNKAWAVRTRLDVGGRPFAVYSSAQLAASSHGLERIALPRITGRRPRAGDSAKVKLLNAELNRSWELDWIVNSPRQIDTTQPAYSMRQVSRDLPHDLDHRRIYIIGNVQPNSPDVRPGWEIDFENLKWVERDPDTHQILKVRDIAWTATPPLTLAEVTGSPAKMAELMTRPAGVLKDKGKDLFPATITYGKNTYDQTQLQDAYRKFDAEFVKSLKVGDPKTTITSFAASFNATSDYRGTVNAVFNTMVTNAPGQDQKNLYLALQQLLIGWLNNRSDALAYLARWDSMIDVAQDTAQQEITDANGYLHLSGVTGTAGALSPREKDEARAKAVLGVVDFVVGKVYPEAPSVSETVKNLQQANETTLEILSRAKEFSFSVMATLDSCILGVEANPMKLPQPKGPDNILSGLDNLALKVGAVTYDYRTRFAEAKVALNDLRRIVLNDLDLMSEVARLERDAIPFDRTVATERAKYATGRIPPELNPYLSAKDKQANKLSTQLPPLAVTNLPISLMQVRKDIWNQLLPTRLGLFARYVKKGTGKWAVTGIVDNQREGYTQFNDLPNPYRTLTGKGTDASHPWKPSEWLASQKPLNPSDQDSLIGWDFHDLVIELLVDNSPRGRLVDAYTMDLHRNEDSTLKRDASGTTVVYYAWDPLLIPTDLSSNNNISDLERDVITRLTQLGYTPRELRSLAGSNIYIAPVYYPNNMEITDERRCSSFKKIATITTNLKVEGGPYYGPVAGQRDGFLGNSTPPYKNPALFLRD